MIRVSGTFPRARRVFEGSLEQLAPIRNFIIQATTDLGCDDKDSFALELAADEAAANAFHHSYQDKPGRVEIELWREDDEMLLQLSYGGTSFDPSRVPQPDLTTPLEQRAAGGLGLYFMRQLMNQIEFKFDKVKGNVVTMRRTLGKED